MAVGYTDVTTFERNFRKCLNASPRQYRVGQQRIQGTHNFTIFAENSTSNAET